MKVDKWLADATKTLVHAGIGTARLDCLVLLEDVTGKDRGYLLAHPESLITSGELSKLTNLLNMRSTHQPLAYVRGKTEFYGRNFIITPAVLEPRPESETMIDLLKKHVTTPSTKLNDKYLDKKLKLADVGSGSGVLGITAKLELPNLHVDLLDIDNSALKISKSNVDLFTLSINTFISDLLANTSQDYDILLCNLPYVPDDFKINQAATMEPKIAIFGGHDGLDLYRKLFEQIENRLQIPLLILTESLPPQHVVLSTIASNAGYELIDSEDFIQVFTIATK